MLDFLMISSRSTKRGVIEIYPRFIIKKSNDLMIRGGDFYAIWNESTKLWSLDEQDALQLIDQELDQYAEDNKSKFDSNIKVMHMWDAESGMIDNWHKYCQKQMRDWFHMLDEKLMFNNVKPKKTDYASKILPYPLEAAETPAYDELISTLYSPDERHKIEWAIGAVVSGDSKKIQKFLVLYGAGGTGKSTVLNIMQQLFEGYCSVFDAKALGTANNSFALEAFKSNPLVAIQHDGDLSRIEDNTRLNSLVSHELMTVNEKFKSTYANRFKCFLFMGTNRPVKITDAKSGLIRRLIDVEPTGNKVETKRYKVLVKQIEFELGGIAQHCLDVYEENPGIYDNYVPSSMLGASNDFYNFVVDSFDVLNNPEGMPLKGAWELYKTYCEDAKVSYPLNKRAFKEELSNYYDRFEERSYDDDGRIRNRFMGFLTTKFTEYHSENERKHEASNLIEFGENESVFDKLCADCPAQYTNDEGTPEKRWDNVKTKLSDLDTKRLHYVRIPENHIVIDFDIPDETGEKNYEANLKEASKFPPTYAELSKSGKGIHLHYIYSGDASKLARVYADHIEIKVYNGNSALRRKLSKCNTLPIAIINSGLPLKGEKVINFDTVKNEKGVRTLIKKNLNKDIHPGTKPSIDFIYKILEDTYSSGMHYDVTDMKSAVISFAGSSTNHADYCLKLIPKMHFKSDDVSADKPYDNEELVFYDVEVFPNLFLINWKIQGEGHNVVRMINPDPEEVEELVKYKLVGFNCRRYDNHILYARIMGYSNEQLYNLSQRIINKDKDAMFGEAYNISYTDVYDFASAGHKQSLKKFEIELGIHHHELGLPWDKPVAEELWPTVAEYCDDDVLATEATFDYLSGDWTARQILADIAGMTVNDTTNSLTTRIIFGNEKHPQSQFNYRNLADVPVGGGFTSKDAIAYAEGKGPKPKGKPYFPGYKYEAGVSTYRGDTIGEGGRVYANPGMYGNVDDEDVASMHPHSITTEELFGPYTARFEDLMNARVFIKHKDFESAGKLFDGKLKKYLTDESTASALAGALKTAINSVYGLTSASFDNPFHDNRNKDNIVAKRGALFMTDLKFAVQQQGYTVVHIKTDSIKIADATPEIVDFVRKFGEAYGYTFETEAVFDKICLVNDAVFIAKIKDGKWTATGTQFAVPYVFKTLFSKEPIEFSDLCETKSVKSSLYLDMNETLPDVSEYEKEYAKLAKSDNPMPSQMVSLAEKIEHGHDYKFVGKVGQFCPIKPGCGGGELLREQNGRYYAATGTKGYRWLESEVVKELNKEDCIDRSYYDNLVREAGETIVAYGSISWFASDEPYLEAPFSGGKIVNKDGDVEALPFN